VANGLELLIGVTVVGAVANCKSNGKNGLLDWGNNDEVAELEINAFKRLKSSVKRRVAGVPGISGVMVNVRSKVSK